MDAVEQKILITFGKVIPHLSTLEKERLLAYGEGMAFKVNEEENAKQKEQQPKGA